MPGRPCSVAAAETPKRLHILSCHWPIRRDIKPENTVFTRERVMKVTDFGLAINSTTERPVTRLGTLDYMAPEVGL